MTRFTIPLACLCLALLAVPAPGEAVSEPRQCQPEPIVSEAINYGDLINCDIGAAGDIDGFRFMGSPNDRIVILAIQTGGMVRPCLELYDPSGDLVVGACSTDSQNRIDFSLKAAGMHTIFVRDRNNTVTGTYHLNLARVAPLPRFGLALRYGEALAGQTIDTAGDLKFFVFGGGKNSRVSLQTVGTLGSVRPCIELYAPDGTLVAGACSTSTQNRIDPVLTQDGTHTVLVRDRNNSVTGTFTVTLQCIVGTCTDASQTSVAATVSPPSLSVDVGSPAIADAIVTNIGSVVPATAGDAYADASGQDALACTVILASQALLPFFSSQTVDLVTVQTIGPPNTPVNIQPGAAERFKVSLTPTTAFCPTDIKFNFSCSNAGPADVLTGVNTLLLSSGPQESCGLSIAASVSRPTFAVSQTLIAGGSVTNPGLPGTFADFYVGFLRPDGSIEFLTSTGPEMGHSANLSSFKPLAVNVSMADPFFVSQPNIFTHQRTAGDPAGAYVFFVVAVKTGALAGGATVSNDQILGMATAPYSFP
jgi:hypothetical protein